VLVNAERVAEITRYISLCSSTLRLGAALGPIPFHLFRPLHPFHPPGGTTHSGGNVVNEGCRVKMARNEWSEWRKSEWVYLSLHCVCVCLSPCLCHCALSPLSLAALSLSPCPVCTLHCECVGAFVAAFRGGPKDHRHKTDLISQIQARRRADSS